MYSAAFSTFLKKNFYGQYLLKYSATFSNLLKLSHAFLVLSTELNGSSYIPLPFQFFLNFFTNFWLFQFKLICSSTLLVFLKLFIDSSWYIPLPFQLCWNYFTNFSFLHIFGHNNPSSISAAFSKLELFHEFLVISTEDDMYLAAFPWNVPHSSQICTGMNNEKPILASEVIQDAETGWNWPNRPISLGWNPPRSVAKKCSVRSP